MMRIREISKNRLLTLFLIVATVAITTRPEAWASTGSCESFFTRIWRSFSGQSEFKEGFGSRELSYRMVERIENEKGETFLVATKTEPGGAWIRKQNERENFRGDPTWNFRNFTSDFMARMGYSVNADQYVIPTSVTLNSRMATLNRNLSKERAVPFRFYTPSTDRVPDDEYLTRFVKSRELPMASHGDEAFHDAHYHFAAIALQPEITEHAARQLMTITGFVDFVERTHPELLDRAVSRLNGSPTLREELARLVSSGAKGVDAITAAPATARGMLPPPYNTYTEIHGGAAAYLWNHMENGKSPIEYLRARLTGQASDSALARIGTEYLRLLEREPANTQRLNLSLDDIQNGILERFTELERAGSSH